MSLSCYYIAMSCCVSVLLLYSYVLLCLCPASSLCLLSHLSPHLKWRRWWSRWRHGTCSGRRPCRLSRTGGGGCWAPGCPGDSLGLRGDTTAETVGGEREGRGGCDVSTTLTGCLSLREQLVHRPLYNLWCVSPQITPSSHSLCVHACCYILTHISLPLWVCLVLSCQIYTAGRPPNGTERPSVLVFPDAL